MYNKDDSRHQDLVNRGKQLEQLLQSTEHSEQNKQTALMDYLNLLNTERASDLGISFTQRMLKRIMAAFEAHPTADLAVDQLYTCLLLQQFHSMQFDLWRAHPAIEKCRNALTMLEAEGRWSDCLRYCQDTANSYAEIHFWPEALAYTQRAYSSMRELLKQKVKVLENGELLDLSDTAFSVITCALHTANGVTPEMEATMQQDLGTDAYAAVYAEAKDAADSEPMTDPVELTDQYLAIRFEL